MSMARPFRSVAAPLLLLAAAAILASSSAAIAAVPTLGDPVLSPDGEAFVYVRTHRNLAEDEYVRELWFCPTDGGESRRLSFDGASVRNLAWRADGALGFIAGRGEDPQVWLNPLDGSEPRRITDMEGGVDAFWWSPDGARLAVLAAPAAAEDDEEEEDEDGDWTVYDRLEQPDDYAQLWIVAVADDGAVDEAPRQLTHAPLHPYHVAWSPDGGTLALTYNARFSSLVDEDQRVALIDAATGAMTPFTDENRHSSLAAFSPDGKRLAYYTDRGVELRAYMNLKDLVVRDLAEGATTVLTGGSDMALGGVLGNPDTAPVWSADGKELLVAGADRTTRDIYRVDARKGGLRKLTDLAGNVEGFDAAAGRLVYRETESHRPGAIWVRGTGGRGAPRRLVDADGAVAEFGLRPPELLTLPGHEGGEVQGFLFLPPGADRAGRHPMIVEMHGGPYYRYGNAWSNRYPWQVLAQRGYAVFIVNPRGGTGYGVDFLRGVYRNFGTDDYRDIMAAVDALVDEGVADPDRLGFTGYSYGGLMTDVVVSRTTRFKAAVSIAGIWNYVSAMGQNNPQLFIDSYRRPWDEDLARMWEHSPASRAAAVRTPTLIMHGEDDTAVDPRQSIEMFGYLQLNGVPSRLVLYPGEGHGINTPEHMRDYLTRELAWFDHYLLGDEEAEGALPPVPVEPPPSAR